MGEDMRRYSAEIKRAKKSRTKMSQSKMQGKEMINYAETNSKVDGAISICIPRVFNNINYKRIKDVFISLGWGYVERVDVLQMRGFKRAYVHFKAGGWNTRSKEAMEALNALKAGDDVTITYDDPWFWKIGISRSARPTEAPKPKPRPMVQIGALKPVVKGLSVETGQCGGVGKEEGPSADEACDAGAVNLILGMAGVGV